MRRACMRAAMMVSLFAPVAKAQDFYWEFRPIGGIAIPTGAHASEYDAAAVIGARLALRLTSAWDLITSGAWQPSNAKYNVDDRRVFVLVYDVGVERIFRQRETPGNGFIAFAGGGVGGRAFDFRSRTLSSTTCYSGYGSVGAGYERRMSSLRVEARDHLFCYNAPLGSRSESTHNEVSLGISVGFRL